MLRELLGELAILIEQESTEWYADFFVLNCVLVDGSVASGVLMVRQIDDHLEYRLPTPEELDLYRAQEAW